MFGLIDPLKEIELDEPPRSEGFFVNIKVKGESYTLHRSFVDLNKMKGNSLPIPLWLLKKLRIVPLDFENLRKKIS